MISFDFTSVVPNKGTTFIFDSWVCIANGLGGFNGHLADTRELEHLQQCDAAISMNLSTTSTRHCSLT
jgi:hypothetical protein